MKSTGRLMASALLLAGCAAPPVPEPPTLAIVDATVVHVEPNAATALDPGQTIVIRGTRIETIGPSAATPVPAHAQIIDGRGRWVVPGLIDGHVHFFQSGNLYTRPDAIDLNRQVPYAQEVARNQARLQTTFKVWLASGVTGVVDVGGPFWNFDVRELARHSTAAPRVAVTGPLISLVADAPLDLGDPPIILATNPAEARALVASQLPRQPQYIKVWFIHDEKDDLAAQTAIVKAAGDAAHAAGLPFAVHATELVVAKAALRAGADYLVHSVDDEPVDDEFIALMKERQALYCPTLYVGMGYDEAFSDQWAPTEAERRLADPQVLQRMGDLARIPPDALPPHVQRALRERKPVGLSPVMAANLRRVWAAGIPVAMGTDAGNIGTLHGPSVFREMALMQQAGLSPAQVLQAATVNGARALRMEGEVGRIAPGWLADLLILDANPLQDLGTLAHAWRVVKDGQVYDPRALIESIR